MVRIQHLSDLHGGSGLRRALVLPDVWVSTGDFFPNAGRCGDLHRINAEHEGRYQRTWWGWKGSKIMRIFGDRPVLCVSGNHDFVSLAQMLRGSGYQGEVYEVGSEGLDFMGMRFAGFREIPRLDGEWAGEVEEDALCLIVARTMEVGNPEILLTHVPPAGVLCSDVEHGSTSLAKHLTYGDHRVKYHLFGHDHFGMGIAEEMGIKFFNSATTVREIMVEI